MASRKLKEEKEHAHSKLEFMLCHRKDNKPRPSAPRVMVSRPSRARIKCMRVAGWCVTLLSHGHHHSCRLAPPLDGICPTLAPHPGECRWI
jgi:hypothetical protein